MGRGRALTSEIGRAISAAVARRKHASQCGRLRILVCSNFFPPYVVGGAELVAYQHAKVLQEWGHEVRIFCGDYKAKPAILARSRWRRMSFTRLA
jgi:hypothetical protein